MNIRLHQPPPLDLQPPKQTPASSFPAVTPEVPAGPLHNRCSEKSCKAPMRRVPFGPSLVPNPFLVIQPQLRFPVTAPGCHFALYRGTSLIGCKAPLFPQSPHFYLCIRLHDQPQWEPTLCTLAISTGLGGVRLIGGITL